MQARLLLLTLLLAAPLTARADDLIVLLQRRNCPDCRLADVDLVHADLQDADLQGAQLQRANLGQALLDGADLRQSNLQFTKSRQWHTTLPTVFMLFTMTRLNHSLSETFKGATSSK